MKLGYVQHFLSFEKLYNPLSFANIHKRNVDSINIVRAFIKCVPLSTFYYFQPEISRLQKDVVQDIIVPRQSFLIRRKTIENAPILMMMTIKT